MNLMDLSFSYVIQAVAVLIVIYEVWKKIVEVKTSSDKDHERKQGWDYAAKVIKEKEQSWDEALKDVYNERSKIVDRYDGKLEEIEKRIDENHTDTEAKIQELRAELFILTECMQAVLEGLHEQGCNGMVSEQRKKLTEYLNERAHD